MKVNLESFKYFLDKVELKNWDELEKKIKNINVEIKVDTENRELYAKTV